MSANFKQFGNLTLNVSECPVITLLMGKDFLLLCDAFYIYTSEGRRNNFANSASIFPGQAHTTSQLGNIIPASLDACLSFQLLMVTPSLNYLDSY